MSGQSLVYFKGLRLGDGRYTPESLDLDHKAADFKETIGSATASTGASGPNTRFECTVEVMLKRGAQGTESASQFWDRVRLFGSSLKAAISYGDGVPQFGNLAFIRDPDGSWTGQQDATETMEAITGSVTQAVDVDFCDPDWAVTQLVLLVDPADPYNKCEIVEIEGVNTITNTITITPLKAYPVGALVLRVEWYLPNSFLKNRVALGGNGPAGVNFRKGISLVFGSVQDPVNGGLTG